MSCHAIPCHLISSHLISPHLISGDRTARHGAAWRGAARHGTARHGTARTARHIPSHYFTSLHFTSCYILVGGPFQSSFLGSPIQSSFHDLLVKLGAVSTVTATTHLQGRATYTSCSEYESAGLRSLANRPPTDSPKNESQGIE